MAWGAAPRPLLDREGWRALGAGWRPRSWRLASMGVKGWASSAQAGAGVAGPWELKALAPSGQCEAVCGLPKGWTTPLSRHSVTVYSVRAKTTHRQSRAERLPSFPTEVPAKAALSLQDSSHG